ncbi:MAG: ribosome small subunit-dependent GTPase A [Mycoplasma sp.]|nr:ribosome small subunit-dependent GTPase A [Mycoplasma sp.]
MIKNGQVIKIIAGFFDVKSSEKIYRLRASGSLRDNDLIPIVGDYVEFKDDMLLTKIMPRKNSLIRPKVANIDQVAIVTALDEPKFSSLLLDKLLAIIEFQNIKTLIIFTKSDIGNNQPYYDYSSQNFDCLISNNKELGNWEKIKEKLKNKLTVLTGQSGAGKTTLLNNLLKINEKTNEISKSLGRGKHTTRTVEIFSNKNLELIDTPGFSSLDIKLTKQELSKSYFDFKEWSKLCKFTSCIHYKEVDCEVKRKYNEKKLLKSRYDNYIKMLLEINE